MWKNKKNKLELIISGDGSHTIYVPELNEHYHSVHGAINESVHVFIEPNLNFCKLKNISILEVGFGTGLNAFLTALNQGEKTIFYHSLEKYPVSNSIVKQLNYSSNASEEQLFQKMHEMPWQKKHELQPGFTLLKDECDLTSTLFTEKYDLVYFDAFAPEKQPEMWNLEIFQKIYDAINDKGILTTYCAKGAVRRNLQACGFKVDRLPGPKGKREILRAIK